MTPTIPGPTAAGPDFHDLAMRILAGADATHADALAVLRTGFGRTGRLFASEVVTPDILCLGKALTGGYLTLAATLCTPAIAAGISASDSGVLMHGPTFMGNPLACAVASASIDLLLARDWRGEVAGIEAALAAGLAPLRGERGVRDVRTLGAVGVVQLDRPVDVTAATEAALAHGVWLRPLRDLVYAMPPYVATADDLSLIGAAMRAAVRAR
ncbi:aminotransferase class III-fold pyridoxal phosphate-dependent enzyme [Nocardioides sp. AE5]|uniref:aminotransferase class III-fold pyridoxal phosphate-dependent enzyme n=1 Tax=Nocardioides sp. AE5 TaxID=2962573 RepID=UPI002880E18C|nr:aminotransferase class III-fold pyridoxal phosphate-dependent enzyme [Nocardioides sp. AE5]MDT0202871.1 aminotransferase class III-fold pyridoxal phosphate-dependent enzyme [Nocardioides sp. AE5]